MINTFLRQELKSMLASNYQLKDHTFQVKTAVYVYKLI